MSTTLNELSCSSHSTGICCSEFALASWLFKGRHLHKIPDMISGIMDKWITLRMSYYQRRHSASVRWFQIASSFSVQGRFLWIPNGLPLPIDNDGRYIPPMKKSSEYVKKLLRRQKIFSSRMSDPKRYAAVHQNHSG